MGLSIKNTKTETKIRRLAKLTRRGLTEAVDDAVSRELHRLQPSETRRHVDTMMALRQIQKNYAAGPIAATGSAEEIIGYNDRGHFD